MPTVLILLRGQPGTFLMVASTILLGLVGSACSPDRISVPLISLRDCDPGPMQLSPTPITDLRDGRISAPSSPLFDEECDPEESKCLYTSYAPPMVWGTAWQKISSHIGVRTFTIKASPIGDTELFSKVKYYAIGGFDSTEFADEETLSTGNALAQVSVKFKGVVSGTGVKGEINMTCYVEEQ